MRWRLLILTIPALALAQEQEVQRALVQRDQQSAGFALQLKQSQEQGLISGDNRHLNERQRLENISDQQLLNIEKDPPQALRPYERQKAADERTSLFAPHVFRPQLPPKPAPLPAHPLAAPNGGVVPR